MAETPNGEYADIKAIRLYMLVQWGHRIEDIESAPLPYRLTYYAMADAYLMSEQEKVKQINGNRNPTPPPTSSNPPQRPVYRPPVMVDTEERRPVFNEP